MGLVGAAMRPISYPLSPSGENWPPLPFQILPTPIALQSGGVGELVGGGGYVFGWKINFLRFSGQILANFRQFTRKIVFRFN